MTTIRACAIAWVLGLATDARAQPAILTVPTPPPNARGWINSPVMVQSICGRASTCPEPQTITTEGPAQQVTRTATDQDGLTASTSVRLNIDYTAPQVVMQSAGTVMTAAASIGVTARATDAGSGLAAATCNGTPVPLEAAGVIRCNVPLLPGVNDIVIEVSDHADNSGSAGVKVRRVGLPTSLTVIPEVSGVLVGSSRVFQVLSDFDTEVGPVTWQVDSPAIATMVGNLLIAHAQGTVTLTASFRELTATATVETYHGDRLPPDATRWKVGGLRIMQTGATKPLVMSSRTLLTTAQQPGEHTRVLSINDVSGALDWQTRPAMAVAEKARGVHAQGSGGALLVTESTDGRSAIVRSVGAGPGSSWRYQSSGTLLADLLVDTLGNVIALETASGFPKLLEIDGRSGVVRARLPLPNGTQVVMNAECRGGDHSARDVAAQIGPLTAQVDGSVTFELMITDDFENFASCGNVAGRLGRTVAIANISNQTKRVDTLKRYEVPAGATPPIIELFPVAAAGIGASLAAWTARFEEGTSESRVTRVTAAGHQEFSVPVAGKIWIVGVDDLAAMTDGTTLVVFNVITGAAERTERFPEGVTIVGIQDHLLLIVTGGVEQRLSLQRPRG